MTYVEIEPGTYDVKIALAYGTNDNFTDASVYTASHCFLHAEAASKLAAAAEIVGRQGYRFLIFDALRPSEAQWALWNHTPDPDFLADPRRGVAIDLTLLDVDGAALDMGTAFDAFTPRSFHGASDIPMAAQRNRLPLGIMSTAGWNFYSKEWWHY